MTSDRPGGTDAAARSGAKRALDGPVPPEAEAAGRALRRSGRISPWLFLGPSVILLGLCLGYPALATVWLSLHGPDGRAFVGAANYVWLWHDAEARRAVLNTCLWLLVAPTLTTAAGLVTAALTRRVFWGGLARVLILLPTAISSVGAAVIWKFIYDYRADGAAQIGLLNAIVVWAGGQPQAWIAMPFWNSLFLMAILVWIQTGFAMLVLAAALRAVPPETVDAALLDGASEVQVFLRIEVPQIRGAIIAVWMALSLIALKVFDIVLAMTNGQWNTSVLASLMFGWMFRGGGDFGRGSAIAVLLGLLVMPLAIRGASMARRRRERR